MNVRVSYEKKRGCGFRKPGGLYLVSPGSGRPCGLLPIPLVSCPTCGHGIKFCRSWTWVNVAALAAMNPSGCQMENCGNCPLADARIERAGLLWIGEKFYSSPEAWAAEAREMGISRRIKSVPRGFKIGETWIAAAHIKAIRADKPGIIPDDCLPDDKVLAGVGFEKLDKEATTKYTPGIFRLFRPTAIEYVVKGTETEAELEDLIKRGIDPVKVEHAVEQEAA